MPRGKKAAGGVNKMEAVRQVLAKHGKETMPIELVKLVKQEHGADISVDVASNYKSTVLRKLGKGGKRGPKPGWKKAAAAASNGVSASHTGGGSISLEDITAVKKLVDQLGAEKVRELAQVLAK